MSKVHSIVDAPNQCSADLGINGLDLESAIKKTLNKRTFILSQEESTSFVFNDFNL